MNILEELYYGNIVPNEKCATLNSEVTELLKLLNRNEEKHGNFFRRTENYL